MKKTKRSASILFKAISRNLLKIAVYYPKMVYMAKHQKKYTIEQLYDYGLKVIRVAIDTSGVKIEAYGLENIPAKDGFYICANHQEKFDPLAIWYTFPRTLGVILDDAVSHRPFIREICKLIKSQKLIRKDVHAVVHTYGEITKDLKKGLNYMIFPEGGYEANDGLIEDFHPGSFKSPQRAHCPILPVAIIDSYKIFDKGYKTSNPIQVHYLEPIQPAEFENMNTTEISALVQSKIKAFLEVHQK